MATVADLNAKALVFQTFRGPKCFSLTKKFSAAILDLPAPSGAGV